MEFSNASARDFPFGHQRRASDLVIQLLDNRITRRARKVCGLWCSRCDAHFFRRESVKGLSALFTDGSPGKFEARLHLLWEKIHFHGAFAGCVLYRYYLLNASELLSLFERNVMLSALEINAFWHFGAVA